MRTSTRPRAHQASVAKQPYIRRVRRRHFQWDSRHNEEPRDCWTGRCCGEGEKEDVKMLLIAKFCKSKHHQPLSGLGLWLCTTAPIMTSLKLKASFTMRRCSHGVFLCNFGPRYRQTNKRAECSRKATSFTAQVNTTIPSLLHKVIKMQTTFTRTAQGGFHRFEEEISTATRLSR